jgi:hypothetical protein
MSNILFRGRRILGHRFSALGDRVLGKFTRQNQPDSFK